MATGGTMFARNGSGSSSSYLHTQQPRVLSHPTGKQRRNDMQAIAMSMAPSVPRASAPDTPAAAPPTEDGQQQQPQTATPMDTYTPHNNAQTTTTTTMTTINDPNRMGQVATTAAVSSSLPMMSTNQNRNNVKQQQPMSRASPSTKMLRDHVKDETLLKVKIKSGGGEPGKFYVPVSLLVDRELEMRKSAKDFGIRPTRWSKSRLFREWKMQLEEDVKNNEKAPRTEIVISLDPEHDCASSNQSHSFQWQAWLTTCIRAYYNTGTIRIPDDCLGSDILLALEYFGILYSPDQLVFDSFGGYLRVKLWSDYFTHRAKMADWVVQKLVTTPSKHSHCFVTSSCANEEQLYFLNSTKTMEVLDGDLKLDADRYGTTPSRAVVHEFFNDDQQEGGEGRGSPQKEKMDELMRQDFCAFVQASLPGTNVSFALKQVTTSNKETVERAVLRINLVPKPSPEQPRAASMHNKQIAGGASTNPMQHQVVVGQAKAAAMTVATAASVSNTCTSPETQPTQPITVSTTGGQSELSTIEKAYEIVRSKTAEQSSLPTNDSNRPAVCLETSFEDRPDDEFTPTNSPRKAAQQHISSPTNHQTGWKRDELSIDQPRGRIRQDDPSIDEPREALQEQQQQQPEQPPQEQQPQQQGCSSEFVRNLSERIIRQTIEDMDRKNTVGVSGGPPPLHQQSPARPFDEGVEPHLTEDDIMQLKLPSLPSLDFDKDYSRRPTELPFQAHPQKFESRGNTPSPHLEVIGTVTPVKTASATTAAAAADRPAPVDHVDVDHIKPCDGSVMSALSNPFDDPTHQTNGLDMSDVHRPQASVEVLSGFRTPVDALSLADDRSVRIEGPEEEDDEEEEEEQEEEDEEEINVRKVSSPNRSRAKQKKKEVPMVEPDDNSEAGCVSNFLNVVCSPFVEEDIVRQRRRRSNRRGSSRHRKYSDDDTPNTLSETDEEDNPANGGDSSGRRKKAARRHSSRGDSDKLSGGEVIAEIGDLADSLVDGIAASFGSVFGPNHRQGSGSKTRRRSRQHNQRSRRRYSCSHVEDGDVLSDSERQPDFDVEVDETVEGESTTVHNTSTDEVITRIVPFPREKVVARKSDRPPLPLSRSRAAAIGSSQSKSPQSETSLERIQEILRSNSIGSAPHASSKKRSANVMRNLELLQSPTNSSSTEDYINRITVVDSQSKPSMSSSAAATSGRQRPASPLKGKRPDGKKGGLLGFLRKGTK